MYLWRICDGNDEQIVQFSPESSSQGESGNKGVVQGAVEHEDGEVVENTQEFGQGQQEPSLLL